MNHFREDQPHPRGIAMAKAVLDAAAVEYIDDTNEKSPDSSGLLKI